MDPSRLSTKHAVVGKRIAADIAAADTVTGGRIAADIPAVHAVTGGHAAAHISAGDPVPRPDAAVHIAAGYAVPCLHVSGDGGVLADHPEGRVDVPDDAGKMKLRRTIIK